MSKRQSLRDFEAELRGRGHHAAYPLGRQSLRDFEAQLRRGRQPGSKPNLLIPRHPGDVELTWDQTRDAIAALEGSAIVVRIVERATPEVLLAVADGTLGPLTHAKHPALFWPVDPPKHGHERPEERGFYLRRDHFEGAVARAGGSVLVIGQGPVLINIRRSARRGGGGAHDHSIHDVDADHDHRRSGPVVEEQEPRRLEQRGSGCVAEDRSHAWMDRGQKDVDQRGPSEEAMHEAEDAAEPPTGFADRGKDRVVHAGKREAEEEMQGVSEHPRPSPIRGHGRAE